MIFALPKWEAKRVMVVFLYNKRIKWDTGTGFLYATVPAGGWLLWFAFRACKISVAVIACDGSVIPLLRRSVRTRAYFSAKAFSASHNDIPRQRQASMIHPSLNSVSFRVRP